MSLYATPRHCCGHWPDTKHAEAALCQARNPDRTPPPRGAQETVLATISPGIHLGYRRNAGAGTWSVRVADSGAEWVKRIAVADDLEPASPPHVLSYWQAIDVARSLARRQPGDP